MPHFSDEEWADYVRGLTPVATAELMQNHADECMTCAPLLDALTRVGALAAQPVFDPPAEAVRAVHQLFRNPLRLLSVPVAAGRILFDSSMQMAAVGFRTTEQQNRHLVYQADDCALMLQIEREPDMASAVLVGQLAATAQGGTGVGRSLVAVFALDECVGHAVTNRDGEFTLEVDLTPGLRLLFELPSGTRAELDLDVLWRNTDASE